MIPTLRHYYRRIYLFANYRLRTAAGGRWADRCHPTDIGFMMTSLCNAKCIHCDIWKNKGLDEAPTLEQYRATLLQLREWLGPVAVYFSGGEALLRRDTTELLAYASSIGLAAELLTHGYWDDQSVIEKVALARPARVTVSLDGIGETHTRIRGRKNFFEKTERTLETLRRMRSEHGLGFTIRLKTVIMEQNLHDLDNIAQYATAKGYEVMYQPVEQNYNTPEDPLWFEHSETWPRDPARAAAAVRGLIDWKRRGAPIHNSYRQLETMIPYFERPQTLRVSIQQHAAHDKAAVCSALTNIQVLHNGDVLTCCSMPPVGNIRTTPLPQIWRNRATWWRSGCCLQERCGDPEKETRGLVVLDTSRNS